MLRGRVPRGPVLPAQGDRGRRCRRCASAATRSCRSPSSSSRRYARRYNRPLRPLSDELRQRFHDYDWPGNVRELENMIKRIVILQDESLVVRELARSPRVAASARRRRRRRRRSSRVGAASACPPHRCRTPAARARRLRPDGGSMPAMRMPEASPRSRCSTSRRAAPPAARTSLAEVAKNASLNAERVGDRRHAAPGALEPPQGRAAARRELQDAAQQDQGVRDQQRNRRASARTGQLEPSHGSIALAQTHLPPLPVSTDPF